LSSSKDDIAFNEWQAARGLLKDFDDRVHDLRKYGFSFITALLAAQSILLPSLSLGSSSASANPSAITDPVKFGVLFVTLVLIVALRQLEKVYQLYQRAANIRAIVLERRLNIELSEVITRRSSEFHISKRVNVIYSAFIVSGFIIGFFVLDSWLLKIALGLFYLGGVIFIRRIGEWGLSFKRGEEADWSLDTTECEQGDTVRIILSNLSEKDPIVIEKDDVAYALELALPAQEGDVISGPKRIPCKNSVRISPDGDYSWLWNTTDAKLGIYRIYPTTARQSLDALPPQQRKNAQDQAREIGLPFELPTGPKGRWIWPMPLERKIIINRRTPLQQTPAESPSSTAQPTPSKARRNRNRSNLPQSRTG
jgi:hypothetical protein